MRENRTSGSEGGGTEQSVLPTPIVKGDFYPVFSDSYPELTLIIRTVVCGYTSQIKEVAASFSLRLSTTDQADLV